MVAQTERDRAANLGGALDRATGARSTRTDRGAGQGAGVRRVDDPAAAASAGLCGAVRRPDWRVCRGWTADEVHPTLHPNRVPRPHHSTRSLRDTTHDPAHDPET